MQIASSARSGSADGSVKTKRCARAASLARLPPAAARARVAVSVWRHVSRATCLPMLPAVTCLHQLPAVTCLPMLPAVTCLHQLPQLCCNVPPQAADGDAVSGLQPRVTCPVSPPPAPPPATVCSLNTCFLRVGQQNPCEMVVLCCAVLCTGHGRETDTCLNVCQSRGDSYCSPFLKIITK